MRWFVEISPIGQNAGPGTTVCVEAPQWKHALQKARALRGDNGALSNFSIELLEDGFRAMDPTTRLRYVVKRAPDDTPQTTASSPPPPPPSAAPPVSVPSPDPKKHPLAQTVAFTSTGAAMIAKAELAPTAAKPAAVPVPSAVVVPTPEPKKHPLAQTVAYSSTGTAALREPVAEAPAVKPAPAPLATKPAEAPAAKPAPAAQPAMATPASEETLPSFVLVGSREENPTESSPLTYREFVFGVAPGTSETEASRLIMDRYEHVRATIESARSGKLINLAVFDHVFHGRPQRRPLVTLTWKDWKTEPPEIRYPAREDAPAASATSPASTPQQPPRPAVATPATPATPLAAAPKAIATTLTSAKPVALPRTAPEAEVPVVAASKRVPEKVVEPAPVKVVVTAPVKAVVTAPVKVEPVPVKAVVATPASKAITQPELVAPKPVVAAAKVVDPAPAVRANDDEIDIPIEAETATPPPLALKPPPPPTAAPPSSKVAAAPITTRVATTVPASPPSTQRKRLSGDDLLTELFEAFGDLHFLRDSLEGAEFVLALTMEKLPSEVGLVSLFDMNKREFVIVRQSGGPRSALCARQSERAPVASTAMRKHHAIVVTDPAGAQRAMDDRWRAIGVELKSLVCAPVELAGRYLGLIEIANPLDGDVYNDGDGNALTYIGQQLGEFVASRGVIVDPEQIKAEARPSAPPPPGPRSAGKKSR